MSTPTRIVNLRQEPYDIYIGRPRRGDPWRWGNPFSAETMSREEAISRFKEWLKTDLDSRAVWMRENLNELKGKRLGCFCKPLACHGDVLARLAEETA